MKLRYIYLIFKHFSLSDWFKKIRRDLLINDDKNLFAFRQLSLKKSFEIFRIQKSDNGLFELEIDYLTNSMKIRMPERENHKF